LKTKDSAPNDRKHSLNSVCSLFLPEYNFDLLKLFPTILTLPHFKRNYNQSLHSDFFLHFDFEK